MFNLSDKIKKVNAKIKPFENDLILIIVIILVAFISFGLGRLSKIRENKTPITVEGSDLNTYLNTYQEAGVGATQTENPEGEQVPYGAGLYVASKSGTKYHYPWCPGAATIKEENKIWFSSKEAAEASGYTPAANCKGL
jgi:hypothetical protein